MKVVVPSKSPGPFINLSKARLKSLPKICPKLNLYKTPIVSIFGAQHGDEGKGKIVTAYYEILKSERTNRSGKVRNNVADRIGMVIKINGGANSGHTVDGLALNLIPGGVSEKSIRYLGIGRGVVADPLKFIWEGEPLERAGYNLWERLVIDKRTQFSDVTHRLLDLAEEMARSEPRGSTGRGISPAYQDEAGLRQIFYQVFLGDKSEFARMMNERMDRAASLIKDVYKLDPQKWNELFNQLTEKELKANQKSIDTGIFSTEEFNILKFAGGKPFTFDRSTIIDKYWEAGQSLVQKNLIQNLRSISNKVLRDGKVILGEHGQSLMLDKRHGNPPHTSASNTGTSEVAYSIPIPINVPVYALAIVKGYDTAVGTHIFPSKVNTNDELFLKLSKYEKGVTTGRQRDIGWFDAVTVGNSLHWNGCHGMAINKVDLLTGIKKLKVCVAYQTLEGNFIRHLPASHEEQRALKPVYAILPGWSEDITSIKSFKDLPKNAKRYIAFIYAQSMNVMTKSGQQALFPYPPVVMVGNGPGRKDVITGIPSPKKLMKIAEMKKYRIDIP